MFIVIIIIAAVLLLIFPLTRTIIFHLPSAIFHLGFDIWHFFHFRDYNKCESGFIDAYCGLFGSGKTVSAVSRIVSDYRKYNGKLIRIGDKLIPVQVHLLSNVDLQGVPYTHLDSLQQIVDWCDYAPDHPAEWLLVLIDEASCILNSRDFSKNLNFYSINSFVCCRHFNLGIVLTSQRFILFDKLLRECTQRVFQCQKFWRVIIQGVYDAYEVENASNPLEVKPKTFKGLWCNNKRFGLYDTKATVKAIEKSCKEGNMLSTEEILARKGDLADPEVPDNRIRRRFRKKKSA